MGSYNSHELVIGETDPETYFYDKDIKSLVLLNKKIDSTQLTLPPSLTTLTCSISVCVNWIPDSLVNLTCKSLSMEKYYNNDNRIYVVNLTLSQYVSMEALDALKRFKELRHLTFSSMTFKNKSEMTRCDIIRHIPETVIDRIDKVDYFSNDMWEVEDGDITEANLESYHKVALATELSLSKDMGVRMTPEKFCEEMKDVTKGTISLLTKNYRLSLPYVNAFKYMKDNHWEDIDHFRLPIFGNYFIFDNLLNLSQYNFDKDNYLYKIYRFILDTPGGIDSARVIRITPYTYNNYALYLPKYIKNRYSYVDTRNLTNNRCYKIPPYYSKDNVDKLKKPRFIMSNSVLIFPNFVIEDLNRGFKENPHYVVITVVDNKEVATHFGKPKCDMSMYAAKMKEYDILSKRLGKDHQRNTLDKDIEKEYHNSLQNYTYYKYIVDNINKLNSDSRRG